ncbi:MAG: metallopeptidase family protein, partial [Pseudomonadota bacterium]
MDWIDKTAPDLAAFEGLAEDALKSLPDDVRAIARSVALRIEDFADDATLADLGMDDPFQLTGLYDGTPLTEKSTFDQPMQPDAIWLFRRPILEEWIHRGDIELGRLVAHVLVH